MASDFDDYQTSIEKARQAADAKANNAINTVGAYGYDNAPTNGITGSYPIPGGVAGIAWGCGQCPDFVMGVLTDDCRDTLRRVRNIKQIVTIVNRLVTEVTAQIISDLQRLASMIPLPPVLDLSALVRMLTCPLTPQAIVIQQWADLISYVERAAASVPAQPAHAAAVMSAFGTYTFTQGSLLATLDPRALVNRVVKLIQSFIRQLRLLIDTFLDTMKGSAYVAMIYRYVREFWQYANSADTLVLRIAVTSASVGLVRATCPDIYARTDLPFKSYNTTMSEFTFDGVLPSGLTDAAIPLFELFVQIEGKLALWSAMPLVLLA